MGTETAISQNVNVHIIEFNFRCPWLCSIDSMELNIYIYTVARMCVRAYPIVIERMLKQLEWMHECMRTNASVCMCVYFFALSKMNLCETKIIGNGRCHLDTDECVLYIFFFLHFIDQFYRHTHRTLHTHIHTQTHIHRNIELP